ncbi:MAG: CDP-glucose 4,6-dehydratase [Flavisolibacter sp.]
MENLVSREYLSSVYRDKKIFITGHTGFKGSWLMGILNQLGAVAKGYALAPENENNLFSILWNRGFEESVIADIRDKEKLQKEILDFQPDFIFHLAAQPLVRLSYVIPAETFDVNVVGTANLLEAIIPLEKKCTVIVVTTDKVYHNREQNILYKEEDQLGGYDPYSTSKACAELVTDSFRNSFFSLNKLQTHKKAIATARAGNVIGGGDWSKDRLMPDIINSLFNQSIIEVRNPKAVRPWQHVLEPLTGYLLLGSLLDKHAGHYAQAYNFGPLPKDHLSVDDLVKLSIQMWGSGSWKDVSSVTQPHEAGLLMLDISKAINELKWYPKLDAEQSVKWTIDWYKQPFEAKLNYTFTQIEKYLAL